MKYIALESQEQFRLDRFIIRMYGEYSQYYADVLAYFNPQVDLINLKAGTVLKVPSREEINSITKIRGYYDLSMDSVPRIKVYPKNDAELGFVAPVTPPVPDPEPTIDVGINLGEILQNDADVPTTFTIYNDGTADLEIAMVRVPLKYRLTTSPLAVIPMGTSSDFVVSLIDTSVVGVWSGDVIVESNAGSVEFPITAEVVADKSIDVLTFRESIGDVVNGKVLGLLPAEKTWRLADGTTSTDDLVSYISTANGEGRLELTSAGDIGSITELQLNLNGAVYTAVPVTAGLSAAAAEAALVAAGLVLGTSTSEMTNDTAAGLVSASVPAAGTGVAAGTAVDITVSLGDRHTSIPIYQCWADGAANTLSVAPITAFDWVHPNGTVQNGLTCTYVPTRGAGLETVWIRCKAGKTVADLTTIQAGYYRRWMGKTDDLIYCRPTGSLWQLPGLCGDVAQLNDVVASVVTDLGLECGVYNNTVYGSVTGWAPVKANRILFWYAQALTGYLRFIPNAPTTVVALNTTLCFSYVDVAQTIINWDAANASSFARTGSFAFYKRSLIGAANPAAEAAIVSLSAKGASWTFLAE